MISSIPSAALHFIRLHPRVLQALFQRHAVLRVAYKQPRDEVLGIIGEMPWELQVNVDDLFVGVLAALLRLEGSVACAQLVAEHTHAPHVDQVVVVVANDDFRRHVVQRSAEGDALSELKRDVLARGMGSPAKIGKLGDSVDDDDVLWLEVSMDDPVFVEVH